MNRGFALAGTVLLTAAVASIALTAAVRSQAHLHRAQINLKRTQAVHAARSGLMIARDFMRTHDEFLPDRDFIPAVALDDSIVEFQVSDEDGKININSLVYPSLEPSPAHIQILRSYLRIHAGVSDPNAVQSIVQTVRSQRRQDRAELGSVFFIEPVLKTFQPGVSEVVWRDFTIHGTGRMNVNSADPRVLQALLNDSRGAVTERVIRQRTENPFQSPFDFRSRTGISPARFAEILPILTVHSAYFTVRATVRNQDLAVIAEMVVHRPGRHLQVLRFREWWS